MTAEVGRSDADRDFCTAMDEMTKSLAGVREVIQSLKQSDLDTKDGISLLTLKHHLLLSYLQSMSLVSAYRVLGYSLSVRTRPPQPFSAVDRVSRGAAAGDLVDLLVEDRIVLDKVKQLEGKMRYQIKKLVRLADDDGTRTDLDVIYDPLAFRPNPHNFVEQEAVSDGESGAVAEAGKANGDIYRPPKVAPMPYTEKGKKTKRIRAPTGLEGLAYMDGSNPYLESSTGLGATPSTASARARELQRMNEFEEENMTRLVMTKKEARRRARDEADVALGGSGTSKGRGRKDGLEDEFADVLRAIDRTGRSGGLGDGYEALRVRGKKGDALSRSRTRPREDDDDGESVKKKPRFQAAVKSMGKRRHR